MKCQHCNENEAVNTFLIAFPGGQQEVHLCEECTAKAQQYYNYMKKANPGLFREADDNASRRQVGSIPIPDNAGSDIQRRRKVNVLRARLAQAVESEHYEEAARLRDQITAAEKDVYAI